MESLERRKGKEKGIEGNELDDVDLKEDLIVNKKEKEKINVEPKVEEREEIIVNDNKKEDENKLEKKDEKRIEIKEDNNEKNENEKIDQNKEDDNIKKEEKENEELYEEKEEEDKNENEVKKKEEEEKKEEVEKKEEEVKKEDEVKKEEEDKKEEKEEEKKEENDKLPSLNNVLEGNENVEKTLKMAKHNSSNLFEKRNKLNEKEDEKEEDKNEMKIPNTGLLSDMIQDKSNNQNLLSDIISGNKEEDKKEEPKNKEMKKFKTDSVLSTKGSKEGMKDRQNRMSKRLSQAREKAKKKDDEKNKYNKSENIMKRASLLENKLSTSSVGENKTIEKNNEMKKNWLIGVTHDIRNPLSIIVGNTEELLQDNVDSGIAVRADNIKNQVFKIKYLLDDINLISRLENYLIDVPKTEIDLQKVLRESMAEVINSYRTDIFRYEFFDVPDEKIKVRADKHLLKRAFENILVNSVVHNTDGCHIVVQIKQEKEGVLIIFDDDGVGAGEIEIEKLNKKTSEHFEHIHGWGTIVTKQIVELYMGKVVFSALDSGMRVTIYLPTEKLDKS